MPSPYSPDACKSGGVLSLSKLLTINASSNEASIYEKKYGADGHNVQDLFMKGDRIRHLGGKFIVVPSSVTDFSIETIHCQTKLMGEYTRVYGEDGFKMADGTHKITKYDMTFVFWMVIDCLLKSKFVGYTANFTENSDVIPRSCQMKLCLCL